MSAVLKPSLPVDQFEFEWSQDSTTALTCHLTHQEVVKEFGVWQGEYTTLCAAYVMGADIYDYLSADQIRRIEEAALISFHEQKREADYDYAASKTEGRELAGVRS